MSPTIAVLVHGTRLPFEEPNTHPFRDTRSSLRRTLSKVLGPDLRFELFEWDGRNALSSRLAASTALRKTIRGLTEEQPEAKLYIIGHSHGGSIAVRALEGLAEFYDRLVLVTLSTPFLLTERRPTGIFERVWQLTCGLVCAAAFLLIVVLTLARTQVFTDHTTIFGGISALGAGLALVGGYKASDGWFWSLRHGGDIRGFHSYDHLKCLTVLPICAKGDEAYGWLSLGQKGVHNIYMVRSAVRWLLFLASCGAIAILRFAVAGDGSWHDQDMSAWQALGLYSMAVLGAFIASEWLFLIVLAGAGALKDSGIGMGHNSLLAALFMETRVAVAPPHMQAAIVSDDSAKTTGIAKDHHGALLRRGELVERWPEWIQVAEKFRMSGCVCKHEGSHGVCMRESRYGLPLKRREEMLKEAARYP